MPPLDGGKGSLDGSLATAVPEHGRRVVAAADAAARSLGVAQGMTVAKARTFAPGLTVVDADPAADADGLRRLALWAGARYAPLVAPDPPAGIWLDVTGCASLFSTERALLKDLHRRSSAFGLAVQIAVADSRADVVKHGMGPDPRDPAERHLGKTPRDIYIPDLRLGSGIVPAEPIEGIKVRTRNLR